MNRCRVALFLAMAIAMPTAVLAAPASQPASSTMPAPTWVQQRLTSEQRDHAMEFARVHMPNLARLADNSPPGRRNRWPAYVYMRMQVIDRMPPDAKDGAIKNLEAEDPVYDLIAKYFDASSNDRAAIRNQVRENVQKLTDANFTDRQLRIEKLKARLTEEEQRLQEDRNNEQDIIDHRVDRLLRDGRPTSQPADAPTSSLE